MVRPLQLLLASLMFGGVVAPALAQSSDVVRLPAQGELRVPPQRGEQIERYVPGGGLLLSFDTNGDDIVTPDEIDAGIPAAFEAADANGSGNLSGLEQQAWAEGLPTRDESLANPVRFDPNLDRQVSLEEFESTVQQMAAIYADAETGNITREDLKAPPPERSRQGELRPEDIRRQIRRERGSQAG